MSNNYIEYLTVSVTFLHLFFGALLFSYKKGNRRSKNFLGSFFIVLGLIILHVFCQQTGFYEEHINLAFILNSLPLLLGPILLFLTKSVTQTDYTFSKKEFLHLIPFTLSSLIFLISFHLKDAAYKQIFLEKSMNADSISIIVSSLILFFLLLSYTVICYRYLKKYRQEIKEQFSDLSKINLDWLEYILIGFMVLLSAMLVLQVVYHVYGAHSLSLNIILFIILLGLSFFILKTIIKAIKSEDIFPNLTEEKLLIEEDISRQKNVDTVQIQLLKEYMELNKPFLNSSINLKDLSAQVDMNSRELSLLINQGIDSSFYDFINSYRIEFAKNMIAQSQDKKQTILEVMYASGFNSKSSFNTAFKKHTKFTPSEWKSKISRSLTNPPVARDKR